MATTAGSTMRKLIVRARLKPTERILWQLLEHGGVRLNAHVEQANQKVYLVIDETWALCGISETNGLLAILAAAEGQEPMRFLVRDSTCQTKLDAWLAERQRIFGAKIRGKTKQIPIKQRTIPAGVVFITGITEYVPGAVERKVAESTVH